MAARVLEDRATGDQLIILIDTEESRGEVFRFEYVARSVTTPPPDHVHKDQEERVEVLEGQISCRMAGLERVLGPGETLTFDPGFRTPCGARALGDHGRSANFGRRRTRRPSSS